MSKTPIDFMLDAVDWKPVEQAPDRPLSPLPFATHSGVVAIGDKSLRCFRLNTGQAVFEAEDFKAFFEGLFDEPAHD